MKTYLKLPVCLAISWLSLVAGASATTLYSNGGPNQVTGNDLTSTVQAEDFTLSTTLGTTATATGVTFWDFDTNGFQNSLVWQIYTNNAGSPGTLLYSGTTGLGRTATGVMIGTTTEYLDTFSLPTITLTTGTTYWLALHNGSLSSSTGASFFWESTAANGTAAPKQQSTAPFTSNGSSFGTDSAGSPEHAFLITVPEPGTWAMLGVGIVGLTLAGRRRRAG